MTEVPEYSSIKSVGNKYVRELFDCAVIVEEKIDGSQFGFKKVDGVMYFRSKGKQINVDDPGMFSNGVKAILAIQDKIPEGLTFRGEYLQRPKHNVIKYDRVPKHHVMIFDIMAVQEDYMVYEDKLRLCIEIGLEFVPLLFSGFSTTPDKFKEYIGTTSVLGGHNIEGVVIKPMDNNIFGKDGKLLLGKLVDEKFKEKHNKEWKEKDGNKHPKDILYALTSDLKTDARFQKALQHLRDNGDLVNAPEDIPKLLREVGRDIKSEEEDWIKEKLFKWAWPQLNRMIIKGLPEWYKDKLMEEIKQ